jgi:hypothetical protein
MLKRPLGSQSKEFPTHFEICQSFVDAALGTVGGAGAANRLGF